MVHVFDNDFVVGEYIVSLFCLPLRQLNSAGEYSWELLAEGREGGCLLVIKIPDSIQDQNCHVFTPVFIHGGLEIMSSLLGLEQEQNLNLNWYSSLSF